MTIIQPSKFHHYRYFFIMLFLAIFGGGIIYIYSYTVLVDSRYERDVLGKKIEDIVIMNVDAKNALYQIIHPTHLENVAKEYNLVLEKQPEYYAALNY